VHILTESVFTSHVIVEDAYDRAIYRCLRNYPRLGVPIAAKCAMPETGLTRRLNLPRFAAI